MHLRRGGKCRWCLKMISCKYCQRVLKELERDCKRISLTRAAEIVREDMLSNSDLFNGTFSQACQQRSVSPSLLTLVNMIPVGTNEQSHEQGNQQATISIAQ